MTGFFVDNINESAFEKAMNSEHERLETWRQLAKDFSLSGIADFPSNSPKNLREMIDSIVFFMNGVQSKVQNWDNLNYRIDLPRSIKMNDLSSNDYARIILFRTFQKVWLREKFSGQSKEGYNELL